MRLEILDKPRKKILPQLGFAKRYGFYLAGGTALALHLGHRTSVDFDFYTPEKFGETQFEQETIQQLKGFTVTQRGFGTLIGQVGFVDFRYCCYENHCPFTKEASTRFSRSLCRCTRKRCRYHFGMDQKKIFPV